MATNRADFLLADQGSIFLLEPITEAARAWVEEHLPLEEGQGGGQASSSSTAGRRAGGAVMVRYAVTGSCGYVKLTLSDILAANIRDAHVLNGHAARLIGRAPRRPELLKPLKEVKPIRELVIAALQSTLKKEGK